MADAGDGSVSASLALGKVGPRSDGSVRYVQGQLQLGEQVLGKLDASAWQESLGYLSSPVDCSNTSVLNSCGARGVDSTAGAVYVVFKRTPSPLPTESSALLDVAGQCTAQSPLRP
jgi:hypothetical protein